MNDHEPWEWDTTHDEHPDHADCTDYLLGKMAAAVIPAFEGRLGADQGLRETFVRVRGSAQSLCPGLIRNAGTEILMGHDVQFDPELAAP